MDEIRYLISDASKKVDVETHVLRYWEEELGLSIPRNEMGHRYYTEFHIRLFCQVKKLKDKGYQLKAIKSALQQVMDQNQGVLETANVLEQDMSRTLQENQYLGFLHSFSMDNPLEKTSIKDGKETGNCIENGAVSDTHLTDYNRLEPEDGEGQIGQVNQTDEINSTSQKKGTSQISNMDSGNLPSQTYHENTSDEADQVEQSNQQNQPIQSIQLLQPAENQASEHEIPEDRREEAEKKIQEIVEKDGQADMKNRGRDRKKPSAWERRNGMVTGVGEKGAADQVMTGKGQNGKNNAISNVMDHGDVEDSSIEHELEETELEENGLLQNVITEEMAREMLRLIDARRRGNNEGEREGERKREGEREDERAGEIEDEREGEREGERKNERKAVKKKEAREARGIESKQGEKETEMEGETKVGNRNESKEEIGTRNEIRSGRRTEIGSAAEIRVDRSSEMAVLASSALPAPSASPVSSAQLEIAGQTELAAMTQDEKMGQFQLIMNHIIEKALAVNNEKLSQDISGLVNRKIAEELEDLMRIRDEREEERYRQIDEIIRSCQRDSQGKAEAAATRVPFFKRKRFGRNGKHL